LIAALLAETPDITVEELPAALERLSAQFRSFAQS
jgi:hypothetical protein